MMPRNEEGVTLIVVAASLLVLVGFAALAIDIGAAKSERRLDQGTADASALAGGVEIIVGGGTTESAAAIRSYVDTNLSRTLSDADWDSCLDTDALAVSGIPTAGDQSQACISFSTAASDPYTIRVRLPDQATATSFGRVLGVDEINTSAFAEVSLEGSFPSGAFPSGIFSGTGAGESFCIRTGSNAAGSCGTSTTGDFGSFQPYFYGPISTCTSGNQPNPLAYVMATGLDHFLGTTPSAPGNRRNGADCPQEAGPAFPNRVDSGSGYTNTVATQGLVTGGNTPANYDGRLTQQSWGSPFDGATVFGESIENRPLWTFIDPAVAAGNAACMAAYGGPDTLDDATDSTQVDAFDQARSDMISCLTTAPDGLFTSDIYASRRLTIVPRYHQAAALGSNACCYDILGFEVIFIDEIWTANGSQWTCDGGMFNDPAFCKHSPGRRGEIAVNAAGQQRVDSASAIVLSCDLLPDSSTPGEEKCRLVENPSGSESTVFLNIFLTK